MNLEMSSSARIDKVNVRRRLHPLQDTTTHNATSPTASKFRIGTTLHTLVRTELFSHRRLDSNSRILKCAASPPTNVDWAKHIPHIRSVTNPTAISSAHVGHLHHNSVGSVETEVVSVLSLILTIDEDAVEVGRYAPPARVGLVHKQALHNQTSTWALLKYLWWSLSVCISN
ncbi:hypothetical protein CROQUDRAFT_88910 [Cronartium quercuum f. sp. fusiforme G11]|uniref:Uncharacterized protein n=1 Tax=Cronartium quercuum f. sp. fusiforme G11 TaxID=708437 RepID=A0A9P6TGA5_9BASI|nr:hypothetical protein CROQUDRAFT_88910 [Cronartium quercuum f. sp. fusiforme G11]